MTKEFKPTHTLTIGEDGGETIPVTVGSQFVWDKEVYVQAESRTKRHFTVPARYVKKLVPEWEGPQPGEVWTRVLYDDDNDYPLRFVDAGGNFRKVLTDLNGDPEDDEIRLDWMDRNTIRDLYRKVLNSDGTPYVEETNEDD